MLARKSDLACVLQPFSQGAELRDQLGVGKSDGALLGEQAQDDQVVIRKKGAAAKKDQQQSP
jgi:hypothetical protein